MYGVACAPDYSLHQSDAFALLSNDIQSSSPTQIENSVAPPDQPFQPPTMDIFGGDGNILNEMTPERILFYRDLMGVRTRHTSANPEGDQ
jgi:hypothetical protein